MDNKKTITIIILGLVAIAGILLFLYSTITFSADIIMIGNAYLSNQW